MSHAPLETAERAPTRTPLRAALAALGVHDRTRATIIAIGIGFILFMHTGQKILFGQSPGGELVRPILKTLTQLAVATLLARALERRQVGVVRVVVATWLASVAISTAFSWQMTSHWGIVGVARLRWILVAGIIAGTEVYALWVVAFRFPLLFHEARVRNLEIERTRQAAELAQLREHLQPHFLRNTLNAIAALITEDPAEARNLLAALGDLLSDSIEDASPFRMLGEEIDWLKRYAEILEARHRGSLRITWHVAPQTAGTRVPRLLLQPLLENAIHHGALARDGGGQVSIRTHVQKGGTTIVEIEDNGPGFDPSKTRKAGLGLRLVRSRLEMEARGALRIETNASGTRAIVELPRHCCAP